MKNSLYLSLLAVLVLFVACDTKEVKITPSQPNIVIIYMDDLGYGELGAYGATKLKTPNMDRLANEGMKFTQGHASSATCTPSRFALLTGMYPWKNKRAKVLPGSASLIIDTTMVTIPKVLKQKGYTTGIVGKWHLGLGDGPINWNERISPGPNELGFDSSYILAATQDRVPTVYIKDGTVVGLDPNDPIAVNYKENFEGEPTALTHPEMLKLNWYDGHNNSIVNGIPRIGYMKGGEKAKWIDEEMADHFLEKAQEFVRNNKKAPFFLYYALQQPHVPRTPHPRFVGSTTMGARGDVIVEADWMIGEFMKTLEEESLLENTLIIFTSDNGPVVNDGYADLSEELLGEHKPAGHLRGGKYSMFEAGTRVPFVTYWKGVITPGESGALVSQLDLLNSLASLVGGEQTNTDSVNLMDTFLGKSSNQRESVVLEASTKTILKKGDWVLIPPHKGPAFYKMVRIESGNKEAYQLYNIKDDLGQQNDLSEQLPEKLQEMILEYQEEISSQ